MILVYTPDNTRPAHHVLGTYACATGCTNTGAPRAKKAYAYVQTLIDQGNTVAAIAFRRGTKNFGANNRFRHKKDRWYATATHRALLSYCVYNTWHMFVWVSPFSPHKLSEPPKYYGLTRAEAFVYEVGESYIERALGI